LHDLKSNWLVAKTAAFDSKSSPDGVVVER
jgi:hypothetical protein